MRDRKESEILEVLVVMMENWTLDLIAMVATCFHRACHWWWSTGESSNLSYIGVYLLKTFEEAVELRPAKVGYRPQASEERTIGNLLEVTLADVLAVGDKHTEEQDLSQVTVQLTAYSLRGELFTFFEFCLSLAVVKCNCKPGSTILSTPMRHVRDS